MHQQAVEAAEQGVQPALEGDRVVEVGRGIEPGRARHVPWLEVKGRGWLVRRALLAADVVGLSVSFALAEAVSRPVEGVTGAYALVVEVALFLAALPCWVVAAKFSGLYDRDAARADHTTADDFFGVLQLLTLGTWLAYAGATVADIGSPQLTKFFCFWAAAAVFVTSGRAFARALCRHHPAYVQNAVVVGAGDVGQLVAHKILKHPEFGINIVGFVDSVPKPRTHSIDHLPVLGEPEDLARLVRELRLERVIIAFSTESHDRTLALIRELRDFDVQVDIVPRLFELIPSTADVHTIEGMSVIGLPRLHLSRSSIVLKRAMDVVLSLAGLLVLAPAFAVIAAMIKLESRGPVFFRQIRVGERDRRFTILKFRTMVDDADSRKAGLEHLNRHSGEDGDPRMFKIPDDPRVTRVGRYLRGASLDELPQLINVLRGEMSLVGPRPLVLDEDQYVSDWARRRLDLKPGITGLWQISGRDAIPFGEMVRLDYFYVTTWSLWNDLRILFRTFSVLGKGERTLQWR